MSPAVLIHSAKGSVNSSVKPLVASSDLSSSPTTDQSLHLADSYRGYDHVTWYVGNAKQTASYYVTRMGFKEVAYQGLETGSRYIASHVVSNKRVTFVLTSPIRGPAGPAEAIPEDEKQLLNDIHAHLSKHGDAVKDVAFRVDDVPAVYEAAMRRGAFCIKEPHSLQGYTHAVLGTYGDTTHTLVDHKQYAGVFRPGFREVMGGDPVAQYLPEIPLEFIDHCVGNQDWDQMQSACD